MSQSRGWFITGTDTGVGKTVVSVALTRALVARGRRVAVMKPVAAGALNTPEGPRNDDALALWSASNVPARYDEVNPFLLSLPASPHLAAREAGVTLTAEPVLAARARLAAASDCLVVEGAGGWLAPISQRETMGDLAAALGLPVILVVGLRLGCLNHALLTRAAIRAHGLPFAGWIANRLATEMPLAADNIETLSHCFGAAPLGIVPTGANALDGPPPAWANDAAEKLVSH